MIQKTSTFVLNGQFIRSDEIPAIVKRKEAGRSFPEWEKELFQFLAEWFSDAEFVQATTSGSTGVPKPIRLTKQAMVKSAERTIAYFGMKPGNRVLLSLPCRYIAGKMMVVRAITGQMDLFAVDPATDFEFLSDQAFDLGALVPTQVYNILGQPSGRTRLQNIGALLIGGAPVSPELEAEIAPLTSRVVSTYGMTETASHIALRELSGSRKTDDYHCLPGITVELDEKDCLRIRLPELDEVLQTNDLAMLLSPASFRILGRLDSVIISGGIKYVPEVLEKKLEGIIERRFVVSSLPDQKLGDQLTLVIEGPAFDTTRLQEQVGQMLSAYERPRSVVFLESFPETPSGKIMRAEIKHAIGRYA